MTCVAGQKNDVRRRDGNVMGHPPRQVGGG